MSIWLCVIAALTASCNKPSSPEIVMAGDISYEEMPVELLPEMNIPRRAHALLYLNEDIVAIGGRTTGFVPTKTAEYFADGKWTTLETFYTHDDGFYAVLGNSQVMVGGGYAGDFGIGQSFGTELYNPETRSFSHLPIMDRKRAHVTALEMENGQVLISGNWYAPDDIELYTPGKEFQKIKDVAQPRSTPLLLKSASDNAIIFAPVDNYGNANEPIIVDRLNGDPFTVPLFDHWRPVIPQFCIVPTDRFAVGNYSHLLLAENGEGALAPMLVSSEEFSIVDTEYTIPANGPWGRIQYADHFETDPSRGVAWLLGTDAEEHLFLLELGYGEALRKGVAPMKMYFTQPVKHLWWDRGDKEIKNLQLPAPQGLLLPDGRYLIAGGGGGLSCYDPTPLVCILYPGGQISAQGIPPLVWGLAFLIAAGALLWLAWTHRSKKPAQEKPESPKEDLMGRLTDLMENRRYYLKKDLRLADVATELGTNVTYISAVVNTVSGKNFPSFLNGYRIRHAQELMREYPDMPLRQVAEQSGFPNETTFLRNFKAQTGLTPSEWKARL